MTKQARLATAEILGTLAFHKGISAPALDAEMTKLMSGCKVGEAMPLLKAWNKNWTLANLYGNVEFGARAQ